MARCSWQLRLTDVALGLGFKGWEYAWLEQVLGDGCGSREMILGYTLRLAGICGLCVVVVVSLRRSVRCVRG